MNNYTLPYNINPKYLPRFWKTEHSEKYISKYQLQMLHKQGRTNTQQLIPFFQYKIR